jgi:hypothetical protein
VLTVPSNCQVPPATEREIWYPSSPRDRSFQFKRIWVLEIVVAVKFVGVLKVAAVAVTVWNAMNKPNTMDPIPGWLFCILRIISLSSKAV